MTVVDQAAMTEVETAMIVGVLADRMRDEIVMDLDDQDDTMKEKGMLVTDLLVDPMKNQIRIAVDKTKTEIILAADKVNPVKDQMVLVTPTWLQQLLEVSFFFKCVVHSDALKAICNLYCLDCSGQAICSHCVADHKYHKIVQIRRLSYHNAIRVSDLNKFINISSVQTYSENRQKVVFLHERPQLQQRLGKGATCEICRRSLIDSFRFCSLGCKLRGIENGDPELTFIGQGTDGDPEVTFTQRGNDNLTRFQGMIESSSTPWKNQNNSVLEQIVEAPILNGSDGDGNSRASGGIAQDTPPMTNYRKVKRNGVPYRAPFF